MKGLLEKIIALSLKAKIAIAIAAIVGVTAGTVGIVTLVKHSTAKVSNKKQTQIEADKDNSTVNTDKNTQTSTDNTETKANDTNTSNQPTAADTSSGSKNNQSMASPAAIASSSSSKTSGVNNTSTSNNNRSSKSTGNSSGSGSSSSNSSPSKPTNPTNNSGSGNKIVNDKITNPSIKPSDWSYDEPATNCLQRNWHGTTYTGSMLNTMNMSLNQLTRGALSISDVRNMYLGKTIDSKYVITNVYATYVTTSSEIITENFFNNVKNAGLFNQTFSGIKYDDVKVVNNCNDEDHARSYRLVIQMKNI